MEALEKNKKDLIISFKLLGFYLEEYEKGKYFLYLPMAVELRKLLCEKDPSPLLTRVIPDFKLYKLNSTDLFNKNTSLLSGLINYIPGILSTSKFGMSTLNLSLSKNNERVEISDWVNQIFFNEKISIKEFIKSVADKEAAHSDKDYNPTLIHCKSWSFNYTDCSILGIYGITKLLYDVFDLEYKKILN